MDKVAESLDDTDQDSSPRQHGDSNSLRTQHPEKLIEGSSTVKDSSSMGDSVLGNWIDSFEDEESGVDLWTLDDFALPRDRAIVLFRQYVEIHKLTCCPITHLLALTDTSIATSRF